MFASSIAKLTAIGATAIVLAGCQNIGSPNTRLGMVKDPATGLMFGSVVERNITTDPSFYDNRQIKVRVRNTSGDVAFDLTQFTSELEKAYASTGYHPTGSDNFGILVDVNVRYSGQVQSSLANEFGFLGAAAGGIAGSRSKAKAGTAIGVVAGATLGSIIGSFIKDDTYIIVADVTFGIVRDRKGAASKRVTFGRSPKPDELQGDSVEKRSRRSFRKTVRTGISVFAGGRNTNRTVIAGQVRRRIISIVSDII